MEEILAYLDPICISPANTGLNKQSALFGKVIPISQPGLEIQPYDIVIIGVNESRNSPTPSPQNSPNVIREYLYGLATINTKGKIVDAGNIVQTQTPAQTYKALTDVVSILLKKNITLIVLGGSQELTKSIYLGYKADKKLITLSVIDSHVDSDNDTNDFHSLNYLNSLLSENPVSLFDISIIGYQGYFADSTKVDQIRNSNHDLLRLGFVRGNYREVEPTLRNSDIVSLDMGVIRSADSPGNTFPSPNGLYAEEACQLARYAGTSDRTTCFGVFEYSPANDTTRQSALLAAQLVWHFIEGSSLRQNLMPTQPNETIKKFIVNSGTAGIDLVFYKDEMSDNWWMEMPLPQRKNYTNNILIPCSPSDYAQASKQEIPERWLRFFHKIQSLASLGK